jgi:hypothetical protein
VGLVYPLDDTLTAFPYVCKYARKIINIVAKIHRKTKPTEWQPLIGEVGANFCG